MDLYCVGLVLLFLQGLQNCIFCSSLDNSLREDLKRAEHVALGVCEQVPAATADLPIYDFHVDSVAFGPHSEKENVLGKFSVKAYARRPFDVGDSTLLFGINTQESIDWSPSEKLSKEAVSYAQQIIRMERADSASPQEWLNLYWENLDSEDDWVSRDSYNAVAIFDMEEIEVWAKAIDPAVVKRRISRERTTTHHRRFYWVVLGFCGSVKDVNFVQENIFRQINANESQGVTENAVGMDAAISTFLLLGKASALQVVEEELLWNPNQRGSVRFAAIAALRVHSRELQVLRKERITKAFAPLLDDPDFADMIIPDLARMEDWSHVEVLQKKFRDKWGPRFLRVPIINYLKVCPLREAKMALDECKKLDPDAFRRAGSIFPFAPKTTEVERSGDRDTPHVKQTYGSNK